MKLRLGILGFAHGHVGMYIAEWRKREDVELVAGWDHEVERARKSGVPVSGSVEEVLRQVDAVVVAAATSLHAELVEQADRIVHAVQRAGVKFTLAWQMRVDPHNLQMKELLQDPRFGRLLILRRRHCLATQHMANFENSWHVNPALNRDIFADDAAHPIDFLSL